MSKRLEKLADDMINLTPEESQKLALIVRAKLMPEIAKQQQQGLLQQANNPMMQQRGKRKNMQMQMPNLITLVMTKDVSDRTTYSTLNLLNNLMLDAEQSKAFAELLDKKQLALVLGKMFPPKSRQLESPYFRRNLVEQQYQVHYEYVS